MTALTTAAEQPPPPEPGTLDAHPPMTRLRGDPDMVRQLARSIHEHNVSFTQVEEYGDGMIHVLALDADTLELHVLHMVMLDGMQLGTYITTTAQNAGPEVRKKLLLDCTDRRFADDEARKERLRDEIAKQAKAAAPPPPVAVPVPGPGRTLEREAPRRGGLLGMVKRLLVGG